MTAITTPSRGAWPVRPTATVAVASSTKDESIETLRGLAIVLVVLGHVALELGHRGMLSSHHAVAYVVESLSYLRMPLFTVIAGYVYALRPVRAGAEKKFALGKLRRVLLPFIFVGLIDAAYLDYRFDGVAFNQLGETLFGIFALDLGHLWYLKAMLWIFAGTMLLDAGKVLERVRPWVLILIGTALVSTAVAGNERHMLPWLALGDTLYILPYFVLGLGLYRFGDALRGRKLTAAVAGLFVAAVVAHQAWLIPLHPITPGSVSGKAQGAAAVLLEKSVITAFGLSATFLLFRVRRAVPGLAELGHHAYAVYLFHGVAFYAGFVLASRLLGVEAPTALVVWMLAAGLLLPVALKLVIVRWTWPWPRRLLLGLR